MSATVRPSGRRVEHERDDLGLAHVAEAAIGPHRRRLDHTAFGAPYDAPRDVFSTGRGEGTHASQFTPEFTPSPHQPGTP